MTNYFHILSKVEYSWPYSKSRPYLRVRSSFFRPHWSKVEKSRPYSMQISRPYSKYDPKLIGHSKNNVLRVIFVLPILQQLFILEVLYFIICSYIVLRWRSVHYFGEWKAVDEMKGEKGERYWSRRHCKSLVLHGRDANPQAFKV